MSVTRITTQDIRDGTILNVDISGPSLSGIDPLKIGNGNQSGVTSGNFAFLSGVGSQVDGINDVRTLTQKTITNSNNIVAAKYLFNNTGGLIDITGNTPTSGQVLTATTALTATWSTPGGGLATSNFVFNEIPSGTVDGSNAVFTLANTASSSGSIRVYKNGIRQLPGAGNDFHCSTTAITFLAGNIPQTNDNLLCDYMK